MNSGSRQTRRRFLQAAVGLGGLSLAELFALRDTRVFPRTTGFGSARGCIVFFSWGWMSRLQIVDPKPDAPVGVRGDYRPIATRTPGLPSSARLEPLVWPATTPQG
jgi:hypothetical protein